MEWLAAERRGGCDSPGVLAPFVIGQGVRVPVGNLPLPVLAAVDLGRA
jgi:hypothetical protein